MSSPARSQAEGGAGTRPTHLLIPLITPGGVQGGGAAHLCSEASGMRACVEDALECTSRIVTGLKDLVGFRECAPFT